MKLKKEETALIAYEKRSLTYSYTFDRRFKALMKYVINGKQKALGEVTDYFALVEFQNRGSSHIHMFF